VIVEELGPLLAPNDPIRVGNTPQKDDIRLQDVKKLNLQKKILKCVFISRPGARICLAPRDEVEECAPPDERRMLGSECVRIPRC
jgi:hypothetical protein